MKEIKLFDYQEDMKERIEKAFESHQSVMVQMPTGTGKTILLAEVVKSEKLKGKNPDGEKSEKLKGKNPCVWIVVHRRELVEQIKETLAKQLDSSLFTFHSSLNPLDSSLFTLHSSLIKVFSIQWLSKHYHELEEKPSLIIIDEAHHAVAKTYKEVMDAYPEAKKLGLTATPCRLTKRGFTDLFDVLLQSWSVKKFIADGWLSLYDYMSIREDSEDWRLVNSLKKRGADGDFSLREMSEKLNVQPSIERLCDTVMRYAANKKGITYAIDIAHAEHIAEAYRQHGIKAVAISSKTSIEERK
ncbi:DEAD/DEAH box helicase [Prevotella merdae]|uniref:DEAD/DEAH box helicase n=1 Tax=Prevotella merdae TaxID=2079531 RepID=UPI003569DA05